MRFSCSLPIGDSDNAGLLSIAGITRCVQALDQAGLDAVFVTDHPAPSSRWLASGGHATLDPFVALSIAAAASERVRLHSHILVLAYRNPLIVAKAIASLDRLSGGRFTVGIGTGYLKSEYAAVGVPFEERGDLTDEAIGVLRQAWSGEPIAHRGRYFECRDNCVLPTPVQSPLPIWGGGNAPRAIRRAVRLCQGWSPFPAGGMLSKTAKTEELTNIDQLREKIAYAHNLASELGRTAPLDICVAALGNEARQSSGKVEPARLIDEYSALAEAGV
ncbi:MAG: LLM class F420-dependent oxidoreductase, partial [Halioglobus sp.]|nr:LLM class F420-dependent oxidoreductase [Halioglobus sp.]